MTALKLIDHFPDPHHIKYNQQQWYADHGQSDVIINCHAADIYFPDHWTPLSMKCAFKGREFYQSSDSLQCASDDQFLMYNQGKEYSSFIPSGLSVESLTINFSEQFVTDAYQTLNRRAEQLVDDPYPDISNAGFHFFEHSYFHNTNTLHYINTIRLLSIDFNLNQNRIHEYLFLLFDELLRCCLNTTRSIENIQATKQSTRLELYRRIHLAKDLIDSSFQTEISLVALSRAAHLNPYYLLRLFRKVFNTSPHQYLLSKRLREAKRLLREGNHSVTEVSSLTGFIDLASFVNYLKSRLACPRANLLRRKEMVSKT